MANSRRVIDKARAKGFFVRFRYTTAKGEQGIRVVQPQGVKKDMLYGIDFTEGKEGGLKSFKLDSMSAVESYKPPWPVAPPSRKATSAPARRGHRLLWLALIVAIAVIAYLLLTR